MTHPTQLQRRARPAGRRAPCACRNTAGAVDPGCSIGERRLNAGAGRTRSPRNIVPHRVTALTRGAPSDGLDAGRAGQALRIARRQAVGRCTDRPFSGDAVALRQVDSTAVAGWRGWMKSNEVQQGRFDIVVAGASTGWKNSNGDGRGSMNDRPIELDGHTPWIQLRDRRRRSRTRASSAASPSVVVVARPFSPVVARLRRSSALPHAAGARHDHRCARSPLNRVGSRAARWRSSPR